MIPASLRRLFQRRVSSIRSTANNHLSSCSGFLPPISLMHDSRTLNDISMIEAFMNDVLDESFLAILEQKKLKCTTETKTLQQQQQLCGLGSAKKVTSRRP